MPSVSSTLKKRHRPKGQNILELVPQRNTLLQFKLRKDPIEKASSDGPGAAGTITLFVPRFKGSVGQGFCRILRVRPWINVNLDAYGSAIWSAIDGKITVRELGEKLKTRFGEDVEPLYGRLAHFLSLLERNAIIAYANLPVNKPTKAEPPRKRKN